MQRNAKKSEPFTSILQQAYSENYKVLQNFSALIYCAL